MITTIKGRLRSIMNITKLSVFGMNTLKNSYGGMILLMFLNDDDKQIIHYILSSYCSNCGLNPNNYFSYNQFLGLCPHPNCGKMSLIKGLIKSECHLDIKDYLGVDYPFNEEWKRFFGCRKGWL